jgi:hypothetical protein
MLEKLFVNSKQENKAKRTIKILSLLVDLASHIQNIQEQEG